MRFYLPLEGREREEEGSTGIVLKLLNSSGNPQSPNAGELLDGTAASQEFAVEVLDSSSNILTGVAQADGLVVQVLRCHIPSTAVKAPGSAFVSLAD